MESGIIHYYSIPFWYFMKQPISKPFIKKLFICIVFVTFNREIFFIT